LKAASLYWCYCRYRLFSSQPPYSGSMVWLI